MYKDMDGLLGEVLNCALLLLAHSLSLYPVLGKPSLA